MCRFGERKKSIERRIPPGYVEYLEEQQRILVKALKQTWQQHAAPGSRLHGLADPPVHSIMEDLGVLAELASHNPDREDFHFEEDLEKLRQQCELEVDSLEHHVKLSRSSSSCSSLETPPLQSSVSFTEPWVVNTPHMTTPPAKQLKTVHRRAATPQYMRTYSTPNCWQPQPEPMAQSLSEEVNPFARTHAQIFAQQQQPQAQRLHRTPSNLSIMTPSVPQSMMDWSFTADLTTPTNTAMPQTPLTPMIATWQNAQASQMYSFGGSNSVDFGTLDPEWKGWVPDRSMSA